MSTSAALACRGITFSRCVTMARAIPDQRSGKDVFTLPLTDFSRLPCTTRIRVAQGAAGTATELQPDGNRAKKWAAVARSRVGQLTVALR
jgi:hypothetical protein